MDTCFKILQLKFDQKLANEPPRVSWRVFYL